VNGCKQDGLEVEVVSCCGSQALSSGSLVTVTLASRHLPLNRLQLAPVDSIEPYLAGYTTFVTIQVGVAGWLV